MDKMQRAQILLETKQHRELAEIARERGTSISEIIRMAVREWLAERDQDEIVRQRLIALEQIDQHRKAILARQGGKPLEVDIVGTIEQIRQERDDELLTNAFGDRS